MVCDNNVHSGTQTHLFLEHRFSRGSLSICPEDPEGQKDKCSQRETVKEIQREEETDRERSKERDRCRQSEKER